MAKRKKTISPEEPATTQPIELEPTEKPKRRRKKADTAPAVEPVEQAVMEEAAPKTPEAEQTPVRWRARRRRKDIPPESPAEAAPAEPSLEGEPPAAPSLEGEAPAAPKKPKRGKRASSADVQTAGAAPVEEEPTRKRRARRRKAEPEAVPEAVGEIPTPQAEEAGIVETTIPPEESTDILEVPPLEVTLRHPIARVHFHRGIPQITFGERVLLPLLFFGNPHTPEAAMRVHQQMQLASEAGVTLFALLIVLPVRDTGAIEAFDAVRYWTTLAREINPDALLLWRIVPVPVGNWQKEFPEAVIRFADGTVGGPSICADRWWDIVQRQLTELVRLVEQEGEGASTLGYHLDWGEWFLPESAGYDMSDAAVQAFREWLRRHFRNDTVSLRASWFNGEINFSTASIPPFVPSAPLTKRQFYDPRREGRWIDYHQFLSDATARRILSLARAVKEACHRRCLVGASYGYVLEWRHPYSGHLALSALLQSEDIDFLSAPVSYADRLPGGTGAVPVPVESVQLHHKLFLAEEDYRAPFGKVMRFDQPATEHSLTPSTGSEEDYNPPLRSAEAFAQVQRRSLMQALTHGFGEVWMDLWGEGWLMHPAAWEQIAEFQKMWGLRERKIFSSVVPVEVGEKTVLGQMEPDLAVLIDPTSLSYVRVGSPLIQQVIVQAREAIMRAGISYGFYLLDDVLRRDFPRSRLVLFLNAWNIKPSIREAIRRRLQRDGRVLIWLYAASLFDNHRHALETAREVTGLALALQPWASPQGSQIVDPLHPIVREMKSDKLGIQQRWEPSFYALAGECRVIGEYIETGLPSLTVAEYDHWRAVFIGERTLTPELLRGIARWAGVHVWCATNDVVQARPPLVHIHASKGGEKPLNLPAPLWVYDLTEGIMSEEAVLEHRIGMNEGESRLFLVGSRAAIEALLTGTDEGEDLIALIEPTAAHSTEPSWSAHPDLLDEAAIALVQPLPMSGEAPAEPRLEGEVPAELRLEGEAPAEPKRTAKRTKRAKGHDRHTGLPLSAPPATDDLLQSIRWRKQSAKEDSNP